MSYLTFAILAAFLLASVGSAAWAASGSHGTGIHRGSHRHGHGHTTAVHHHHHGHVGIFIGPAFGYYAPYHYPYPPVVVAPSPPVYIERSNPQPAAQTYYWYYCSNPEGYYPYVQECPGGWQRVAPQPAS